MSPRLAAKIMKNMPPAEINAAITALAGGIPTTAVPPNEPKKVMPPIIPASAISSFQFVAFAVAFSAHALIRENGLNLILGMLIFCVFRSSPMVFLRFSQKKEKGVGWVYIQPMKASRTKAAMTAIMIIFCSMSVTKLLRRVSRLQRLS